VFVENKTSPAPLDGLEVKVAVPVGVVGVPELVSVTVTVHVADEHT
jgi:hypothetical protein